MSQLTPQEQQKELLRIKSNEYPTLTDWQIAELLNQSDSTLPLKVELNSRKVGPGLIMETIGASEGASLLDSLQQLAQISSPVKWALKLIEKDGIDVSSTTFREQLDNLVVAGKISQQNAAKIKALAEVTRYPSWAEYHQIEVTPRTVGLARGGK